MDKVTSKVRSFYETYPYPPGGAVDCDGYHACLLMSYVERPDGERQPIRVLEAGCGRGLNLQAAAGQQPEAEFTGIDINRVAIREARQAVAERQPANLRFALGNLLDASSMPPAPAGYDLILSYGVIHHLSDPLEGLRLLRQRLAPHGVVALMVDGSYGRQPLDRYLEALAILARDEGEVHTRMTTARQLARVAENSLFKGNCWAGTSQVDEVEFADRCLHVHERSYDIHALWQLLEAAGLRFIRWMEPDDWSAARLSDDPELQRRLSQLDSLGRYRLIERLCYRPKLTLIACAADAQPRIRLERAAIGKTLFCLNPQLKPLRGSGNAIGYRLRARQAQLPDTPCEGELLKTTQALDRHFTGDELAGRMLQAGFDRDAVCDALLDLEAREWIYRPHAATTEGSA